MTASSQAVGTDREVVITRVLDAPRELVFKAWASPEHLDTWFGPEGFRNETLEMDFRVGGVWRFIMHGPDGVDYPNRILYTEIAPPDRIAYIHTDDAEPPQTQFQGTVSFIDKNGRTELTLRSAFATAEERDLVVAEHGAIEGGKQTLARLAAYLESMS
jgi:uncharacterized protein YndB with AHSA1/START domain